MLRRACSGLLYVRTRLAGQRRSAETTAATRGTRSAIDLANTVSTPARSSRVPLAGHVGLAEADQTVAADPAGQSSGLVQITIVGNVGSAAPTTVPSG